ncbi:hypothetical protein [Maritalea porphyrae]|uniref:hypothetical protein n=1 Tax=Maritalea porphyrae TaxID=880732 RepID=UPI0022AFF19F|nr:hypothetical protein [Maritalea porphyrae]MCZ4270902.1 hypothetical protein [Maritalea porphyrae]
MLGCMGQLNEGETYEEAQARVAATNKATEEARLAKRFELRDYFESDPVLKPLDDALYAAKLESVIDRQIVVAEIDRLIRLRVAEALQDTQKAPK